LGGMLKKTSGKGFVEESGFRDDDEREQVGGSPGVGRGGVAEVRRHEARAWGRRGNEAGNRYCKKLWSLD